MVDSLSELNVRMDSFVYESAVVEDGSLKEVVAGLRKSPLCRDEGGASYLDLSSLIEGSSDEKHRKRFVFTRSDGSALYTTRDLAYHRWKLSRADVAINVLGEDHKYQSLMLRLALRELDVGKEPEAVFYSFVSLPEGKMSTRRNRVVFLDDLLEEAVARAREEVLKRREDLPPMDVEAISRKVGIGALRFNMIRVQPEKQIVFRWEDALNFEGASAPFVQYSYARACSILEKGGIPSSEPRWDLLVERSELQLAKRMAMFPNVLSDCVRQRKPHLMANYLVEAASAFSDFYRDCPVLQEYNPERRLARIGLCRLVRDVLSAGLGSLGIEAPQTM
jgi:arginyl-tRNA synthetase